MSQTVLTAMRNALLPSDLVQYDAKVLDQSLSALWTLAKDRKPGEIALDLHNVERPGAVKKLTRLHVVMDNMPFVVDSILAELQRRQLDVYALLHPYIHIKYNDAKAPSLSNTQDGTATAFIEILFDRLPIELHRELLARLEVLLADISAIDRDMPVMQKSLADLAARLSGTKKTKEAADFLLWCNPEHFYLLGVRQYDVTYKGKTPSINLQPKSAKGLIANAKQRTAVEEMLEDTANIELLDRVCSDRRDILVTKTRWRATLSGSAQYDRIEVRQHDDKGKLVGMTVFVGLFTVAAHSTNIFNIPYMRARAEYVQKELDLVPNNYDHRTLMDTLNNFPRDEYFCLSREALLANARRVLDTRGQSKTLLFVQPDYYGIGVSCVIYTQREGYQPNARVKISQLLEKAFGGYVESISARNDQSPHVRLRIAVAPMPGKRFHQPNHEFLEKECALICRSWSQQLGDILRQNYDSFTAQQLETKFGESFSASFQEAHTPASALEDILAIQRLLAGTAPVVLAFTKHDTDNENASYHLNFYQEGEQLSPSKLLQIVENLGLTPITDHHFTCEIMEDGQLKVIHIHDFPIRSNPEQWKKLDPRQDMFEEAVQNIWQNLAGSDSLNKLLYAADLNLREVILCRAIGRYLMQVRLPYSQQYFADILNSHPAAVRMMVDFFHARFDPAHHSQQRQDEITGRINEYLTTVQSIDEDRVLRRFFNVMQATVRTNFYQQNGDAFKPKLALKIRCADIMEMPQPSPLIETFVYAHRVEGIHLRSGKVSRGGIRWSDRREDFRDEVLDLMKAQKVKNSVIVPMGAKGGFYVKRPPIEDGRAAMQQEGVECYKIFIRALLDITDNLVDGKIVKPKQTICYDEDDSYLVVAADKGTARFSDIANDISKSYNFWLGDAFASGGSAGYDHKVMGITARGAWESVRHHGYHMGIDVDNDPITVVGVGDMGGDVFGNGLLSSPNMRLVAAFSYSHIICDPDPDPAKSFAERKRLFDAVANWDQYNQKLLSKGGKIFSRSEKTLTLTPEIKASLGIQANIVTPEELMLAILKAQVDLLWFGGIGTYVKGTDEVHAAARDKANDGIRINGNELRCRMIGEGANLGMTQRGRIEAARAGVALNADFIDNSAGVNSSDYEVNLKILFSQMIQSGEFEEKKRNATLESMTDTVAEMVLANNISQNTALGIAQALSVDRVEHFGRLILDLEENYGINRMAEFLPTAPELNRLATEGTGITRPENSVVMAYTKLLLTDLLVKDKVVQDPILRPMLLSYFPQKLRTRYEGSVFAHPLADDLVAMLLANQMVNQMSCYMPKWLKDRTGQGYVNIARAYIIANEIYDFQDYWAHVVNAKGALPANIFQGLLIELLQHMDRVLPWFLNQADLLGDLQGTVSAIKPHLKDIKRSILGLLPPLRRAARDGHEQSLIASGVDPKIAADQANLRSLAACPGIISLALACGFDVKQTAITYFLAGERFDFDMLREKARCSMGNSYWQRQAMSALIEDFSAHQLRLTRMVLSSGKDLKEWEVQNTDFVQRLDDLMGDLHADGQGANVTHLTVANRRLRGLIPEEDK